MSTATSPSPSTVETSRTPALAVRDLSVDFQGPHGLVPAVRGVSFDLMRGEVLGVVGESGSGKSVTSLAAMGLLPQTAVVRGSVRLGGEELLGAGDAWLSKRRGNKVAMVFQDPLSAFTPVYRLGDQIAEAVRAHHDVSKAAARDRAISLLDLVGIPNPSTRVDSFPHEFSGGMRQRAMIAMAIANDPDVILADEPTTALDVTIQAQILRVLRTAQQEAGAAMVLVSHDLGVIAGAADRVGVMYAGRMVESGGVDEVFDRPRMPYTLGLIGAVPRVDHPAVEPVDGDAGVGEAATKTAGTEPAGAVRRRPLVPIPGSPPAMQALDGGCPFADRCPLVIDVCRTNEPELTTPPREETTAGARLPKDAPAHTHRVACHRWEEIVERDLAPADIYPLPEIPPSPETSTARAERASVLRVTELGKTFPLLKGTMFKRQVGSVYAVDGVELDIRSGETLGLVGESGSGKSTTLFEILSLATPEAGEITLLDQSTRGLSRGRTKQLRGEMQIVFQDPMASLDPRMPVSDVIAEPLRALGRSADEISDRVPELLRKVGLKSAHADRFPHQFSGGQRQRIGVARALAVSPRFLVLDEPVSALDVSIQAGVLNLLQELKADMNLAYLFVSHDLSVVRHIADRVSVMYLGRTVEAGEVDRVFEAPQHPYTRALLSAVPIPDPKQERARERLLLPGDPPSPTERQTGCRFRGRCPAYLTLDASSQQRCENESPELLPHAEDHVAACHYPGRHEGEVSASAAE